VPPVIIAKRIPPQLPKVINSYSGHTKSRLEQGGFHKTILRMQVPNIVETILGGDASLQLSSCWL